MGNQHCLRSTESCVGVSRPSWWRTFAGAFSCQPPDINIQSRGNARKSEAETSFQKRARQHLRLLFRSKFGYKKCFKNTFTNLATKIFHNSFICKPISKTASFLMFFQTKFITKNFEKFRGFQTMLISHRCLIKWFFFETKQARVANTVTLQKSKESKRPLHKSALDEIENDRLRKIAKVPTQTNNSNKTKNVKPQKSQLATKPPWKCLFF